MDELGSQEFIQDSLMQWRYIYLMKSGKKYVAMYQVLRSGFIRELFSSGDRLIWDREFKAGDLFSPTVMDVIKAGGNWPMSCRS